MLPSTWYFPGLWQTLMESALWAALGIFNATWCLLPPVSHEETAATSLPVYRREELMLGLASLIHAHHIPGTEEAQQNSGLG